jgi:hypothetical protein
LEIFSYSPKGSKVKQEVNKFGFAHIAFMVEDVKKAKEIVLKNEGKKLARL